jgi:hypothetical protein
MMNRQKSHVDLLECTNSIETHYTSCAPASPAIFSHAHVRIADRDARSAFVASLKIRIAAGVYHIDSSTVADCMQRAPITNALLGLKADAMMACD